MTLFSLPFPARWSPQPPAKLHRRLRTSIHPPLALDKPDWPTWQPGITSSVFEAASEGYKGQPADSPFGHDIAPYDGMPNLRWLLLQVFKMLRQTQPGPLVPVCQRELLLPFMEGYPQLAVPACPLDTLFRKDNREELWSRLAALRNQAIHAHRSLAWWKAFFWWKERCNA
ncbi:uncharacterized protein LOC142814632 isoform X2 [Rhipicephalus microplus]|uniref:uncharacterized protein LOC142814632 isoform X2 n=1 Tax=Rhipicephalus microplus TaxID=6941 RepID=UPI003F6C5376